MAHQAIIPAGSAPPLAPYSPGVRVGNTVYVSGVLAMDSDGNIVGEGDFKEQTRQVLESIKGVVEAAGGAMSDIAFNQIFLSDLAGYAAMNYGVGRGMKGFVVMITIGTGLGSGAFLDGRLIPNFELGQIPYNAYDKIETWAAASAKEREGLSYKKWGKRFNKFLKLVELLTSPDTIILGGGTSKDFDEFKEYITIETPVIPAGLQNDAGIIGAATACLMNHPEMRLG